MLRRSSQCPPTAASSSATVSSPSSSSTVSSSSNTMSSPQVSPRAVTFASTVSPSPSPSIASTTASSAIHLRRQRRRTSSLRHHLSASYAPRPCTAASPYHHHHHHEHNHQQRPHHHHHHHHHHLKSLRSTCKNNVISVTNPALAHKLRQMALPLSPLVQLTTGAVHPNFPTNVLQFWLLTDAQLESLAIFYHQTTPIRGGRPSPWAAQYPCPVRWCSDAPLEEKRRRMGRFIGLRGCGESSPSPPPSVPVDLHLHVQDMNVDVHVTTIKTEDEIARDARMARLAAAVDQEALRRKAMAPGPGPWGR